MLFTAIASTCAHAGDRIADNVTHNFQPNLHNGACVNNLAVVSDGSIAAGQGWCPEPGQPTYEITLTFNNPSIDEFFQSMVIWANSGSVYTDGELRIFDVEIDHIDPATNTQVTFTADDVDIGNTLNDDDPKTVTFSSIGGPTSLRGISEVRMSNLRGSNSVEVTFREFILRSASPQVRIVKTAAIDDGGDGVANRGDTVTYTYTVTNTGEVTVFNAAVTEPPGTFSGAGAPPSPTFVGPGNDYDGGNGTPTDMRPNESLSFTATYPLEQPEIDAGTLSNQARVDAVDFQGDNANDLSGATVSDDAPTVLPIASFPSLAVDKFADNDTARPAGATVTYTYRITNTGNVTIDNVQITDAHNAEGPPPTPTGELLDLDAAPLGDSNDAAQNGTWDSLAPGDRIRFTGTYAVTQQDVDTLQ